MTATELAELLLTVMSDRVQEEGHGRFISLNDIAAQFGEKDLIKLMDVGNWMQSEGLVEVFSTCGATSARILAAGKILVEQGGRTGIIEKYRHGLQAPAPFPSYPGPSIKREDVVNYLLRCKAEGWCQAVYQGDSPTEFIIVADDNRKIVLEGGPQGYSVVAEHLGSQ